MNLSSCSKKGIWVVKQNVGPVTTKDIADCLMEVVDFLVGDFINLEGLSSGMAMGAMGGYTKNGMGAETPDSFSHFYSKSPKPMRTRNAKQTPSRFGYSKTRRPTL